MFSDGRMWKRMLVLLLAVAGGVWASDGGSSVYPLGVETVLPGLMPGRGGTMLLEFNLSYLANRLADSGGNPALPGFHLRVNAVAGKIVHNWGVRMLGGQLVSSLALPLMDIHLSAPFGNQNKIGFGNADLETTVAYDKGDLHWWYGVDAYAPGFSYRKTDLVNVGQHNYAVAPAGAFTYLPGQGRTEIGSKFQCIVNRTNPATNYRSGNEFVWEFVAMRNVTRAMAIGANGYYYRQTSGDTVNGLTYLDGNRGQNLAFGPEIRWHLKHYSMILKWHRDFLVENRPAGNAIWLQFGIPLGAPHRD